MRLRKSEPQQNRRTLRRFGYYVWLAGRKFAGVRSGLRSDPKTWTDERHRDGLAGEEQAIAYLKTKGWHVVAHRFRVGRAEIDLVARRGRLVAFVEVKVRRGEGFGKPFEAVTGQKRREMVKVARGWIDRHGQLGDIYRFDCIGLQNNQLEHLEDAFRPGWR